MTPAELENERQVDDFLAAPYDEKVWRLVSGAALAVGAVTKAQAQTSHDAGTNGMERAVRLLGLCTEAEAERICVLLAQAMPVGGHV